MTSRLVTIWLVIGLIMVYFQIIIGGITRLTGSGLSITEWDIVMGTFPPMTELQWEEEFIKYQETPQYEKNTFTPTRISALYGMAGNCPRNIPHEWGKRP